LDKYSYATDPEVDTAMFIAMCNVIIKEYIILFRYNYVEKIVNTAFMLFFVNKSSYILPSVCIHYVTKEYVANISDFKQ